MATSGGLVSGSTIVRPSGDQSGVSDTNNIQAALNNPLSGIVYLGAGTYYVASLSLPGGAHLKGPGSDICTFQCPAGQGATTAMVVIPTTTTTQVIVEGITLNGTNGAADPFTYLMQFATLGSFSTDAPILSDLQFTNTNGIGLFYGGNRGNMTCYNVNFNACGNQGASIGGSDSTWYHSEFGYCQNGGFTITGEVTRMHDIDVFNCTYPSFISAAFVTIDGDSSFNQNGRQALVVNSSADDVFIEARFSSNGNSANNTYPHVDVSAAAPLGVTFGNNCHFIAVAGGSYTNTTTYDVYANGVGFLDFSNFLHTASTSGHTDLACTPPNGSVGHVLKRVRYVPVSASYALGSTLVALDSTNQTLPFIFGPSGIIKLRCMISIRLNATSGQEGWTALGWKNHTGGAQVGLAQRNIDSNGTMTFNGSRVFYEDIITGTPGTFLQLDLCGMSGGSIVSATAYADNGSSFGPAILEAIEA